MQNHLEFPQKVSFGTEASGIEPTVGNMGPYGPVWARPGPLKSGKSSKKAHISFYAMHFSQKLSYKKYEKLNHKMYFVFFLPANQNKMICSIRFRPPEPLKHSNFEENRSNESKCSKENEKYFPDFAIYIKNDADSDFDTLIYDL